MWFPSLFWCIIYIAQTTDKYIFGVITIEDKRDVTNYSLWSFMLKNVLATKGLWDYVPRDEVCFCNVTPATPTLGEVCGAIVFRTCTTYSKTEKMGHLGCTSSGCDCFDHKVISYATYLFMQDITTILGVLVD